MRRRLKLVLPCLLCVAAAPALAQTPPPPAPPASVTAPPDKIDPGPIRPDKPAAPDGKTEAPSPSADASTKPDDALGVPAQVTALRVAGPWQANGKRGFSRVIGVLDGDRQRFYVQWLEDPDFHVVETKELEDPDAAELTFGDVRAEPADAGVTVFLDTVPDKEGMRDTWVVVIGEPGDVRFGPATN